MEKAFEDLVLERSGGEFVERVWLTAAIDQALARPGSRIVLVTGEPGTGKTSLMAGLARTHSEWLRYFVGAENRGAHATGDVSSFLLSIGHQLASHQPQLLEPSVLEMTVRQRFGDIEEEGSAAGIRIADLTVSPFYRTAQLTVEQQVGRLAGTLIGVEIGTARIEPRLLEPDNLAHLALFGPAAALAETDPDGPGIVIVLDALDEASRADRDTRLLEWLATGPPLPPNVKFVVTSRPQSALGLLRAGRAGELTEILVDTGDRHVTDDLISYAEKTLATAGVAEEAQARGLFPDQFLRQAARRADGNFLYLASYVRALRDAIESGDSGLVDQLFTLEDLPQTLAGIYGFFVELARVEIDRLGLLDIQDPIGAADQFTPAWEGVGQPYGQLDEILQRHRDGRLSEAIDVSEDDVPELIGQIMVPLIVRPDVVEQRLPELRQLAGRLQRFSGRELDPHGFRTRGRCGRAHQRPGRGVRPAVRDPRRRPGSPSPGPPHQAGGRRRARRPDGVASWPDECGGQRSRRAAGRNPARGWASRRRASRPARIVRLPPSRWPAATDDRRSR